MEGNNIKENWYSDPYAHYMVSCTINFPEARGRLNDIGSIIMKSYEKTNTIYYKLFVMNAKT